MNYQTCFEDDGMREYNPTLARGLLEDQFSRYNRATEWMCACYFMNHVWLRSRSRVVSLPFTCSFSPNHAWFSSESRVVSLQIMC